MIKNRVTNWVRDTLGTENVFLQTALEFADFTINPSQLKQISKDLGITAQDIIGRLSENFGSLVEKVELNKGFLNILLKKEIFYKESNKVLASVDEYVKQSAGEKIVIDYSGPNIAKPFSVGHLRSTVIGQANYNIHQALGYEVIGVNHIGDWGTQFGKLIYAVRTWGDEETIAKDPINQLVSLYQRFHTEVENNPAINEEAAAWFRKLELKDEEATELWKKCIAWSYEEFDRLYELLGVHIDEVKGESFYADKAQEIIEILEREGLLKQSQGAKIIEFENMPPAIIQKTNESTLYITRDLATIKYRIETYQPKEIIYHVGNDQGLHFKQLFKIAEILGWTKDTKLTIATHGMIRLPEGKMSTRLGRVVLLQDLIAEAVERVKQLDQSRQGRNLHSHEMDIAISAIKYADLATNRQSDVVFSFDRLVDLKGNSAIYLQYAYARASSLISQYELSYGPFDGQSFTEESIDLLRLGLTLSEVMMRSASSSQPNILCDFAYKFASSFNSFYEKNRIITDDKNQSEQSVAVIYFFKIILGKTMDLLGITKLEKI